MHPRLEISHNAPAVNVCLRALKPDDEQLVIWARRETTPCMGWIKAAWSSNMFPSLVRLATGTYLPVERSVCLALVLYKMSLFPEDRCSIGCMMDVCPTLGVILAQSQGVKRIYSSALIRKERHNSLDISAYACARTNMKNWSFMHWLHSLSHQTLRRLFTIRGTHTLRLRQEKANMLDVMVLCGSYA